MTFRADNRLRIGIVAVAVVVAIAYVIVHPPRRMDRDLNAFYCGAQILASGGDPYRYQPLYECQARNMPPLAANVAVPPALPPYALALFVPLARLPFPQADAVWDLLVVAAALTVAAVVVELTALPAWLIGLCLFPTLVLQSFTNAGLAPIAIALLCLAALALAKRRPTLAAILLGCAAIEPNLALPPAIVVLALVPWVRARLLVVAFALTGLSALAGIGLLREYVVAILPAHASSELGTAIQYGLSSALFSAGTPARVAIAIGSLQYALFVLLGWWLARRLQGVSRAVVVLAPMACAVVGGTFIHFSQLWAFLPFALLIAATSHSRLAWIAVALLAVPWQFAEAFVGSGAAFQHVTPSAPNLWAESAWRALAVQEPPSVVTWISHGLTYAGIAVGLWSAISLAAGGLRSQRRGIAAAP